MTIINPMLQKHNLEEINDKSNAMREIFILIKHQNLIETDKVEVLKVSKDKDILVKELNNLYNEFSKEYKLLENTESYVSFTNAHNEILIELMIEGREY